MAGMLREGSNSAIFKLNFYGPSSKRLSEVPLLLADLRHDVHVELLGR